MRVFRILTLSVLVVLTAGLRAEEGMWMPQQIPALAAKLRALGFVGDPKSFADLTGQPWIDNPQRSASDQAPVKAGRAGQPW